MRLFEFEAKEILRDYGIAVPLGRVAANEQEAEKIAREIGKPVVIKAQVLVAGRGKAGGIIFADSPEQARQAASGLFAGMIKGIPVERLLVEERLDIERELFASVAVDTQARSYVAMASGAGGVDVESTVSSQRNVIARRWFQPVEGLATDSGQDMAAETGQTQGARQFGAVIDTLCQIALEKDAELVETNPLVRTRSGRWVAADARITVDDNSLFRHPEFQGRSVTRADDSPLEAEARRQNLPYVEMSGTIGIVGNGAGLVMATLDLVEQFGGKPANFLDIGGGARPEIVKKSLLLVMSKPEVKSVIVNILGGITRCDLVAQGVVAALDEATIRKPVSVRMIGTNEEEGTRILEQAGVHVHVSMEDAVRSALESQQT